MIDIKKAQNEFLKYTENYDLKDDNIKRKQGHSLRVMNISNMLSKYIGLKEEQVELATLIGLLHDIGRFEQQTRFGTFRDIDSLDHGFLGVKILETNNYIRKFIEEDKYDEIIKKAIFNHNKYSIEQGLNDTELLYAKIIRDADKIDILYEAETIFYKGQEDEISNSTIDKYIQEQIKSKCQIARKKGYIPQGINNVMGPISFIYDINFKESFKTIKDKNYINNILDRFKFTNEETKEKVENIRTDINKYIEEKLK
jgi:putative nucleotidyltransferase with HDIG domain